MTVRTVYGKTLGGKAALPLVGVGLRSPHVEEVLTRRPDISWFEVHPENYMHNGAALARLEKVRQIYPLSLHGVALSLGSVGPLNAEHLARLKALVDRLDPFLVSEHLSWSASDGAHLPDLLPLPYTDETLDVMAEHVDQTQEVLRRPILLENPSGYLRFRRSTMHEASFLSELVKRTGCRLLCDVNNIFVTCHNLGLNAGDYLNTLPAAAVAEIHLAGHSANAIGTQMVLIDDHASRVSAPVWAFYRDAIARFGTVPALIEWDNDLPPLDTLLDEAATAQNLQIEGARAVAG